MLVLFEQILLFSALKHFTYDIFEGGI